MLQELLSFFTSYFLGILLYILLRTIYKDGADKLYLAPFIMGLFFNPFWCGILGALIGHTFSMAIYYEHKKKQSPVDVYKNFIYLIVIFLAIMMLNTVNLMTKQDKPLNFEQSMFTLDNVYFINDISKKIVVSMMSIDGVAFKAENTNYF